MKKYLAITLGPILEIIGEARSTRELAAASGFFSDWGKAIVENLDKEYCEPNRLLPKSINRENEDQEISENYPDRFIYKILDKNNDENVLEFVNKTKLDYMDSIYSGEIKEKAKWYFQCHAALYECEENEAMGIGYQILDNIELLQYKSSEQEKKLGISRELLEYYLKNSEYANVNIKVPSTSDIAVYSLFNNREATKIYDEIGNHIDNDELSKKKILEISKKFNIKLDDKLAKYSNYVVVVQGDGDGVGSALKTLYEENQIEEYNKLQENLNQFASLAKQEISKFGGYPVYVGGDDILCFLPVIGNENKLFIEFMKELDEFLKDSIDGVKLQNGINSMGLSFGATIYYYKYPLEMARENSSDLLFRKAKYFTNNMLKDKCCTEDKLISKNAIALDLIKHSGKKNSIITSMSNESKKLGFIIDLWKDSVNIKLEDKDNLEKQLTSVIHKLNKDKLLMNAIIEKELSLKSDNIRGYIDNYFNNNFNETIHLSFEKYFEKIKGFVNLVYLELLENIDSQMFEKFDSNKIDFNKINIAIENMIQILEIGQFLLEREGRKSNDI